MGEYAEDAIERAFHFPDDIDDPDTGPSLQRRTKRFMPTNNRQPISVAEVLEMSPGEDNNPTWLNDVVATVVSIEQKTTKTNKPYWPCELADTVNPSATIDMTMWTVPKFKAGSTIMVTGKGARLTQYEGNFQIALGKASEVHVTNAGAPSNGASRGSPANDRQEANLEDRPARGATSDRSDPPAGAKASAAGPVNGQTVGMAVKAAIDVLIHNATATDGPPAPVDLPTLQTKVEAIASAIIAASRRLESGLVKAAPAGEDVPY